MHNPLNLLLVEDEDLAAKKLKKMLFEIDPGLCCIGITDSIESTVEWLKKNGCPDLIFMDIELADGQSFEIFSRIEIKCPVIFTTAYDEFALKAFKVNSIDYLLKPIKPEELKAALDKFNNLRNQPVRESAENKSQQQSIERLVETLVAQQHGEKYRSRFLVKSGQRLMPIGSEAISYFFTEDKIVFMRTRDNNKFAMDYTLDDLEQQLDPKYFFRANRQYILNSICIDEIHTWFNGKLKVTIKPKPDEEVIVSRERAGDFKGWLGE
jgi:DNA-binding LytR/AlgR family response regulator